MHQAATAPAPVIPAPNSYPGALNQHSNTLNRHSGASRNLACGERRFAAQTT